MYVCVYIYIYIYCCSREGPEGQVPYHARPERLRRRPLRVTSAIIIIIITSIISPSIINIIIIIIMGGSEGDRPKVSEWVCEVNN